MLDAASRVGEASSTVLSEIHEEDEILKDAQDTLLGLGKAVANKAAALVLRGKSVASTLGQPDQNRTIGEFRNTFYFLLNNLLNKFNFYTLLKSILITFLMSYLF